MCRGLTLCPGPHADRCDQTETEGQCRVRAVTHHPLPVALSAFPLSLRVALLLQPVGPGHVVRPVTRTPVGAHMYVHTQRHTENVQKQHRELARGLDAVSVPMTPTCYLCQQTTPSPLHPVFRMTWMGRSHEGPRATVHTRYEVPALSLVTRTKGPAACDSDRRVRTLKCQLSFCINGTPPPQVDTGASWRQGRLSRPQEPWAIEALSRWLRLHCHPGGETVRSLASSSPSPVPHGSHLPAHCGTCSSTYSIEGQGVAMATRSSSQAPPTGRAPCVLGQWEVQNSLPALQEPWKTPPPQGGHTCPVLWARDGPPATVPHSS